MAKRALNMQLTIPETEGLHPLLTAPSDVRLVVKLNMVNIESRRKTIDRILMGPIIQDPYDFDDEFVYVIEPEQTISVFVNSDTGHRSIEVMGYIELDRYLCVTSIPPKKNEPPKLDELLDDGNVHTVIYMDDNGGVLYRVRVNNGHTVRGAPTPEQPGKLFVGWYGDEGPVYEDRILVAEYKLIDEDALLPVDPDIPLPPEGPTDLDRPSNDDDIDDNQTGIVDYYRDPVTTGSPNGLVTAKILNAPLTMFFDTMVSSVENRLISPKIKDFTGVINWGDGRVLEYNGQDVLTYMYDSPGTYYVQIWGEITSWDTGVSFASTVGTLIALTAWGNECIIKDYKFMFAHRRGFIILAEDAPKFGGEYGNSMEGMFYGCSDYNSYMQHWDVSQVVSLNGTFFNNVALDQPLDLWVTSSVENMDISFSSCISYNQDLSGWDVGNVMTHVDFDASTTNWNLPKPIWSN